MHYTASQAAIKLQMQTKNKSIPLIETHPFEPFIPDNIQTLIIGSFPGREQTQILLDETHWYYGSKRNQFWTILSGVYGIPLNTKAERITLFSEAGIGITDILLKVKRTKNTNLDENLEIIEYNKKNLESIFKKHNIKNILFTSKFVEKHFKKCFPDIKNTDCLPSPSPRYAKMTVSQKIELYKKKLPKITHKSP